MTGVEIIGSGHYLPEFIADNNKFSEFLDTSDEWIFPRTGIKQRHIAADEPNHSMGIKAAKKAVEDAGIDAAEIDLIIATTCTPDFFYPAMSCLVQKGIGAKNASCFDVNSACTGFITAVDIAQKFLSDGKHRTVLIVSSEKLSSQQDYTDRASCILFGDAAGAVILRGNGSKRFSSFMGAEGDEFEALYCKIHYESNCPFYKEMDADFESRFDTFAKKNFLCQDGKAVYKFAVNAMTNAVNKVAGEFGISPSELDLVIPHQANLRIIAKATEMLEIPPEKVYTNIEYVGNVSSACIPVALDELRRAGRVKTGMKLCLVGFGAGLTYGSVIMDI